MPGYYYSQGSDTTLQRDARAYSATLRATDRSRTPFQAAECLLAQAQDLDNARRGMAQLLGFRPQHAALRCALFARRSALRARATSLMIAGRSRARAAGAACLYCLTIGAFASPLVACSSEEKPPRSASYSDGTTPPAAPPYRDLPGDGNGDPLPPAAPPRERPIPDSERVQGGLESILGGTPRPPSDGGTPETDAGAAADADAAAN